MIRSKKGKERERKKERQRGQKMVTEKEYITRKCMSYRDPAYLKIE